jgi:hypothetical protein
LTSGHVDSPAPTAPDSLMNSRLGISLIVLVIFTLDNCCFLFRERSLNFG